MGKQPFWNKLREAVRGRRCVLAGNGAGSAPTDFVPSREDITIVCQESADPIPGQGITPTLQVTETGPDRVALRILDPELKQRIGESGGVSWTTLIRDADHYLGYPHFSANPSLLLWDGGSPEYLAFQVARFLEPSEIRWHGVPEMPDHAETLGAFPAVTRPRISVIVCTEGKTPGALENCLRSLSRQEFPEGGFEVILVDTGEEDVARKIAASHPHLTYAAKAGVDLSGARNLGSRLAAGDILAFLDDRAEVSRGWLQAVGRVFDIDSHISMAGGRVLPSWKTVRPSWFKPVHLECLDLANHGDDSEILLSGSPWLSLRNCAIRKAAFEEFGGFESREADPGGFLHRHEGRRLQERIRNAGGILYYDPDLVAFRPVGDGDLDVNFMYSSVLFGFLSEEFLHLERRGQGEEAERLFGLLQRRYQQSGMNPEDRKLRDHFEDLLESAIFLQAISREERFLKLAHYEEKKGDLQNSQEMLNLVLSQNPEIPEVWLAASRFLVENGESSQAEDLLRKGVGKFPDNPGVLRKAGSVFLENKNLADAETCLLRARQLSGGGQAEDLDLARTFSAGGRKEEAIEEATRILEKTPQHIPSLLFVANEYLEQDRREEFFRTLNTLRHWMPGSLKVKELEEAGRR